MTDFERGYKQAEDRYTKALRDLGALCQKCRLQLSQNTVDRAAIDKHLTEIAALKADLEAERVRHAGCLIAAEGFGYCDREAWGWSPASQAVYDLRKAHDALKAERDACRNERVSDEKEIDRLLSLANALKAEVERERLRLAACGVVALANTPESALRAREMHYNYQSASCDDVAKAVDREMELRAEVERLLGLLIRVEDGMDEDWQLQADLADDIRAALAAKTEEGR